MLKTHTHRFFVNIVATTLVGLLGIGTASGQTQMENPDVAHWKPSPDSVALCGTPEGIDEEELRQLPWADNNQYLVEYLRGRGITLPADYIEQIKKAADDTAGVGYEPRTLAWEETHTTDTEGAAVATGMMYVPIRAWVYQRSDGSGGRTTREVQDIIAGLNAEFAFSNVPITFYLKCGIGYIPDSYLYDRPDQGALDYMWSHNWDPTAVNVHFVNEPGTSASIGGATWAGIARRSGASDFFGLPKYWLTLSRFATFPTIAHEMGHALGLLHTHNARDQSSSVLYNTSSGDCYQEPYSRSRTQEFKCFSTWGDKKAEVNGDALVDTPGDPILFENGTSYLRLNPSTNRYEYNGGRGTNDRWGEAWQPDAYNIMGYGVQVRLNTPLTTTFTPMQATVMSLYASRVNNARAALTISGPTTVCPGTYQYSVSPATNCTWTVPNGWNVIRQGSSSVLIDVPRGIAGGTYNILAQPDCDYVAAPYQIRVGASFNSVIQGSTNICPDNTYDFEVRPVGGANYQWFGPTGWPIRNGTTPIMSIDVPAGVVNIRSQVVQVGVQISSCGTTTIVRKSVTLRDRRYCEGLARPAGHSDASNVQNWRVEALPNPAHDRLTVRTSLPATGTAILFDSFGRAVQQQLLSADGQSELSLTGLMPGLYLLRVTAGEYHSIQHIEVR